MSVLTRPILEINLDNLEKNYRFLQTLAQGAEAAAVVKDDAYGLGAETVAERLYENAGCRTFSSPTALKGKKSVRTYRMPKFTFCRESAKTAWLPSSGQT